MPGAATGYDAERQRELAEKVLEEQRCPHCGGTDFKLQRVEKKQKIRRLRCSNCRAEIGIGFLN